MIILNGLNLEATLNTFGLSIAEVKDLDDFIFRQPEVSRTAVYSNRNIQVIFYSSVTREMAEQVLLRIQKEWKGYLNFPLRREYVREGAKLLEAEKKGPNHWAFVHNDKTYECDSQVLARAFRWHKTDPKRLSDKRDLVPWLLTMLPDHFRASD